MDFKELCGADSLMIAREAAANPSIFSDSYDQNVDNVIKKYLEYVIVFYPLNNKTII